MELPIKALADIRGKIAVLAIAAAMAYFFLGAPAARAIIGISVFWVLPAYILISRLNLSREEKLFFSCFSGIIIVPSLVYWLAFALPFRVSIYAVAASLLAAGIFLGIGGRKKADAKAQQN